MTNQTLARIAISVIGVGFLYFILTLFGCFDAECVTEFHPSILIISIAIASLAWLIPIAFPNS